MNESPKYYIMSASNLFVTWGRRIIVYFLNISIINIIKATLLYSSYNTSSYIFL